MSFSTIAAASRRRYIGGGVEPSNWAQDAVDAHETRVLADGGIIEDKAALLTYLQS